MPASPRSLRLTDAYRARLLAIRERLQAQAERTWPTIDTLDGTDWPERMAAAVTQAQTEAVRVSAAYLAAYLTTETGRRARPPVIDSRNHAGLSRDGRPLTESLNSPLIGTLGALKEGLAPPEALSRGLNRAKRMVGVDYDHAHRTALLSAIDADENFTGWERSVRGTCGACAGLATGPSGGLKFEVHPGCACVASPIVRGVPNRYPVLTGAAIFAAKSTAEQDEMLGPEVAEKVRSGEVALSDLVERSRLETDQSDFITQAAT